MLDTFNRPWEVIAHDYNSPMLRNYVWVNSLFGFKRYLQVPTPLLSIISESDAIHYLTDLSTWNACHEALKTKCLEDNHYLENLIDQTCNFGEEFGVWAHQAIALRDMKDLSNDKLSDIVDQFIEKQGILYTYGIALPILDFAGFSFVEGNLNKFLDMKAVTDKRDEYFQVFTHPSYNSFAQDQEEDLLRLMHKYYNRENWKNDVAHLALSQLQERYPDFAEDLKHHTTKYGWVYYVYAGPAFSEQNFLEFMQDYLKKDVNPQARLQELDQIARTIAEKREKYITELEPSQFEESIIRLSGKVVWAKPRRKDYQSRLYWHMEKVMKEIGSRLGLSLRQARTIPPYMIREALQKEHIDINYINSLYKRHACVPDENSVAVLQGEQADQFVTKYYHQAQESHDESVHELKGTCACRGKATGIVRVINQSTDMHKMQDGDILVSIATTPAIVPAMRRAAAIITDEGGLTCHAAIVSRELQIPCVVGTKICTHVLKDGDLVEVDANKGIVRIINE